MKFPIDRCAGHRLALWLREEGHDVLESKDLGADPGDRALLKHAAEQGRILVTADNKVAMGIPSNVNPDPAFVIPDSDRESISAESV